VEADAGYLNCRLATVADVFITKLRVKGRVRSDTDDAVVVALYVAVLTEDVVSHDLFPEY